MTILTEPPKDKRKTLSLCRKIKYSNTTEENKRLVIKLMRLWDRRDNVETVS